MLALRKLHLPDMTLDAWREDGAGHALIRNAPALEHLKVYALVWYAGGGGGDHDTSALCVPWRIVEVQELNVSYMIGLPLGTTPGQAPLILRVMQALAATERGIAGVGADHLVLTAPGKRQVQLECTHAAYGNIQTAYSYLDPLLRVLTLTTTGLSNLILDGIDSADDVNRLVDLTQCGLTLTMSEDGGTVLGSEDLLGLRDLPQIARLELGAESHDCWDGVDDRLLASLPAHVTHVRLSGGPSLELVARMCVRISGLPHRQVNPLQLCVPGMVDWFGEVVSAVKVAGITTPGVVQG